MLKEIGIVLGAIGCVQVCYAFGWC